MSNISEPGPQAGGGAPPELHVEPLSKAIGPMLWLLIPMVFVVVYAIVYR